MQINEIFGSIDGEGVRSGYLTTFIRTQFCNLRCKYCDTKYSLDAKDANGKLQYYNMTVDEIVQQCRMLRNKRVTLTGGEPLIQPEALDLVQQLIKNGFEVNIETNGAVPIDDYVYMHNMDLSRLIITMDWKSPYSGMNDQMLLNNLKLLRPNDVLKFVVANDADLSDMKQIVDNNNLQCNIFVSPVFGEIQGEEIVEWMKKNDMQNVRAQVQLHKIFWDPNKRGV